MLSRSLPSTTATASRGTMLSRKPESKDNNFNLSPFLPSNFTSILKLPFSPLMIGKNASGEKPIVGLGIFSK